MPKLEIWWCAKEEVLPGSAAFGLAYTCAHAWWVDDTTVVKAVVGWTATTIMYCFMPCGPCSCPCSSWKISLGIDTHWAVWHAAGHLSMLVGSIALASGNCGGQIPIVVIDMAAKLLGRNGCCCAFVLGLLCVRLVDSFSDRQVAESETD